MSEHKLPNFMGIAGDQSWESTRKAAPSQPASPAPQPRTEAARQCPQCRQTVESLTFHTCVTAAADAYSAHYDRLDNESSGAFEPQAKASPAPEGEAPTTDLEAWARQTLVTLQVSDFKVLDTDVAWLIERVQKLLAATPQPTAPVRTAEEIAADHFPPGPNSTNLLARMECAAAIRAYAAQFQGEQLQQALQALLKHDAGCAATGFHISTQQSMEPFNENCCAYCAAAALLSKLKKESV